MGGRIGLIYLTTRMRSVRPRLSLVINQSESMTTAFQPKTETTADDYANHHGICRRCGAHRKVEALRLVWLRRIDEMRLKTYECVDVDFCERIVDSMERDKS